MTTEGKKQDLGETQDPLDEAPLSMPPRRKSHAEKNARRVDVFGRWVNGAFHTQRLATEDPLYGDMFGWTGFEYANRGDYILQAGVKEARHRKAPYDVYQLIRREACAFMTSAAVYPCELLDADCEHLIVKSLIGLEDGRRFIGLYAVNFDNKSHTLHVSLPIAGSGVAKARIFDAQAHDWVWGQQAELPIKDGAIRYRTEVPRAIGLASFRRSATRQSRSGARCAGPAGLARARRPCERNGTPHPAGLELAIERGGSLRRPSGKRDHVLRA